MNIYIIIYFILMFLNLGIILALHGKENKGKHNFFISLFSFLLVTWLLYRAGCFDHFIL